jgi:hypothetical protein
MVGINQNGSGLGLPVRADGKDGGKDRCQKYAKLRLHQNSVALKFGDRQTTPIALENVQPLYFEQDQA